MQSTKADLYEKLGFLSLVLSVLGGVILGGVFGFAAESQKVPSFGISEELIESPNEVRDQQTVIDRGGPSSLLDTLEFGVLFGLVGGYLLVGLPCQMTLLHLAHRERFAKILAYRTAYTRTQCGLVDLESHRQQYQTDSEYRYWYDYLNPTSSNSSSSAWDRNGGEQEVVRNALQD